MAGSPAVRLAARGLWGLATRTHLSLPGRMVAQGTVSCLAQPVRHLNIHEAYSLDLMSKHGINTPRGILAHSASEAAAAAEKIARDSGCDDVVLKAQVLAGGRGKGHFNNGFQGGVHMLNKKNVEEVAGHMIGANLITKQTGSAGRLCNKVLICEKMNVIKEYYFAVLMDRASQGPVVIGSSQGGMDIEAVAEKYPDAIVKQSIDIDTGLTEEQCRAIANKMAFSPQSVDMAVDTMMKLYSLFLKCDATMCEINPMALDKFGNVICMDAKFNFDDNAEFRQRDLFTLRDETQENPTDVEAAKHDLSYIGLDGSIGCLVNGAGLAMATMDIIQLHGGSPANFLDVGGGATAGQVTEAFRLITSDPHVSCILVNIFGGIMRCDVIAEGIVAAAKTIDLQVPVVVRLQGTKVEEARAIITSSGLPILSCDELDDAARKAVKVSQIVELARASGLSVKFADNRPPVSKTPKEKLLPDII